jgi:hypothetical protein
MSSDAQGSVGAGATNLFPPPNLFSQPYHHDNDNPLNPALAIARAGGEGGPIFVYAEEELCSTSWAGGGRQWF